MGQVYLAIHKKSNKIRAIKKVKKETNSNRNFHDLHKEIYNLVKSDHANIMKIYEFFDTKKEVYIVMEYCPKTLF